MGTIEGPLDESPETWKSDIGELVISHPVIGVIVFTYRGHITIDAVPVVERAEERICATGVRPDLFIDLERVTGYDSEYREAISKWGARNYHRHGEVRVLVRSILVAMGIAVSNLTAEKKLKPTTKRSEFEAAIAAAVQRHRQRIHADRQNLGQAP